MTEHFLRSTDRIRGPDRAVEIDATLLVRRKYNFGRVILQVWVFGDYDIKTKCGFAVLVSNLFRETLFGVIRDQILPVMTIIRDLWVSMRHSIMKDLNQNVWYMGYK